MDPFWRLQTKTGFLFGMPNRRERYGSRNCQWGSKLTPSSLRLQLPRPREQVASFALTMLIPPPDLDEYMFFAELKQDSGPVRTVTFSPCDELLVTGSADTSIKVWQTSKNARTWSCVETLYHKEAVHSISFCLSPKAILAASEECILDLGADEIATSPLGRPFRTRVPDHAKTPRPKVSPHEGNDEESSRSAKSGANRLGSLIGLVGPTSPPPPSESAGADTYPTVFASASADGMVKVWALHGVPGGDKPTVKELAELVHTRSLQAVAFSKRGRFLASGSSDSTIKIWSTTTWTCVQTLGFHKYPVCALAFSPSKEKLLVSGDSDGTVRIRSAHSG